MNLDIFYYRIDKIGKSWYIGKQMSKRFLANFLKRRLNIKIFETEKKSTWGSEQIKKLKNLGQDLIIMQMS